MKTNEASEKKYKRGTIGHASDKLAKKYGTYTNGIMILAFALEKALSDESETFRVSLHGNQVYRRIMAREADIIERLMTEIKTDQEAKANTNTI